MATFDQTTSDYSREHMVTFENLGNLIGDVAGQLFQQQAVAHIPYYIQKMTGGDVKKVTDLSKNLALAYMAATSAQLATPKEAATFLQKAQKFYEEKLIDGITKKGTAGLFARGLSEGVEETMEEVTTDLIEGVFKGAEALGVNISVEGKTTDFGFSLKDIASRYAMSFGGGFIGGMVFAGQNKYAK